MRLAKQRGVPRSGQWAWPSIPRISTGPRRRRASAARTSIARPSIHGHVYRANLGTNSVGRADINGQNANPTCISGASFPFGITVDSDHVYWTNMTCDAIGRADLDGQNVNQGLITGASSPRGVAVD